MDPHSSATEELERPGRFPYTRGVYPGMYRDRLWTMRQYAGLGDAAESNRRYRYLLSQGITGLSVAFDLPTQMGYDSDNPRALGEVGRAGVAVSSLRDMEELLDGIPQADVSTSMTINSTASIVLALYVAVARRHGAATARLRGTVQNDILKEYIARGTYIYPPKASLRIVTDLFAWAAREMPKWNIISISGYHMREAGATAAQEVAFTIANAFAYIEAAIEAGLEVDAFAPRLSFFFSSDRNFLEETAKFRAARRLYALLMKERFQPREEGSVKMRFHVQTAGSSLTAQQPYVNVVRTAYEALAAVLGGAQSLHTNGFDEALALPTEQAAKLALRTQQVIAEETGIANTADPLGGSYEIEKLADRIEDEARAYLDRIDSLGGMPAAIEQGYVQREIENAAYEFQRKVESGEQKIVGVNVFQSGDQESVPTLRIDAGLEERRRVQLDELRSSREQALVDRTLEAVAKAARRSTNLMPPILDAVESYATVGEISDVLREAFGEYRGATAL
jgi:methylmalonyl-CoA mutase N-terminal domain/subunit